MEILRSLGKFILDTIMVAGVAWPFYPQAKYISTTGDTKAFSLITSLVVIVASTFRCFFWIEKRFETALLIQAMVAILTHLGMIYVVVSAKRRNMAGSGGLKQQLKTLSDLDWSHFWAWDDWTSYAQAHMLFTMVLMACQVLFSSPAYTELLGTLALGIEAFLPVPQAVRNHRNRSTHGVSSVMVISWLLGDALKTVYFIANQQPAQFIACGVFQLSVDVLLAAQMYILFPQTTGHVPIPAQGAAASSPASLTTASSSGSEGGSVELSSPPMFSSGSASASGLSTGISPSASGLGAPGLSHRSVSAESLAGSGNAVAGGGVGERDAFLHKDGLAPPTPTRGSNV